MPDRYEREILRKQQTDLLAALWQLQAPPAQISERQCTIAATSLLNKRIRTLSRSCASLELADGFVPAATRYSRAYPGVHPGGAGPDAQRFYRWLLDNKLIARPHLCSSARIKSWWRMRWHSLILFARSLDYDDMDDVDK